MAGDAEKTPRGAIIKRRWAIIPGRGGRAVILATVGAIALGNAGAPQSADDPGAPGPVTQSDSASSSGAAGPRS
jgi:hypothetical protein